MVNLYINASDVAAAIGENKYKPAIEIYQKIIDRRTKSKEEIEVSNFELSTDSVEALVATTNDLELIEKSKKIQERTIAIKKENPVDLKEKLSEIKFEENVITKKAVEKIFESAVTQKDDKTSISMEKEKIQQIKKIINIEDVEKLTRAVKSHVNTERGTRDEERIIEKHEKISGSTVTDRNEKMFYLKIGSWVVGGKIDGFDEKEHRLVEVKRRRNRHLGCPIYEKIQIEIYMRMLGVDHALHIEEYNQIQKTTEYKSNAKLWKKIEDGLEKFRNDYQLDE